MPSLLEHHPECKVYTTEYGKKALASDTLNLSKYHETFVTYVGDNVVMVHERESMNLFKGEPKMQFYETSGHNSSCLTMVLSDLIFTGDSYIPEVGANTPIAA